MINFEDREANFYAGGALDRADQLRGDESWFAELLSRQETRFVLVWRSKNLIAQGEEPAPRFLGPEEARPFIEQGGTPALLGLKNEEAYVALDLSHIEAPEGEPVLAELGEFQDLRAVGPLLPRESGSLLAYARGLLYWHGRHRFCGVCGHPTESRNSGHLRACTNEDCGAPHFPRTDPAVIMLVHDDDRCLLGRQNAWPPGMHSTLAGFVEPGESLEEAVQREIREEVGIATDEVRYHSSQPWPFPSSLMIGFHARARSKELVLNPLEIESASWFTREELRASPENETLRLPRRDSIAWRLVEDWLKD